MAATDLIAFSYNVSRTPLAVLEETVVRKLSRTSVLRQAFDRGFGSMDLVAGRLFGDQSLVRQGNERLGRQSSASARRSAPVSSA